VAEAGAAVAVNYQHSVEAADEVCRSVGRYGVQVNAYQADVSCEAEAKAIQLQGEQLNTAMVRQGNQVQAILEAHGRVISEFLKTGQVPNFPSAILAVALELAGMLAIAVGLVLSAVSRRFQELEAKMEMLARPPARRPRAGSEPDLLERRRHGRA